MRRLRSAEYKQWLHDAGWLIKAQHPGHVAGLVTVLIEAPLHRRRDVDNAIKPTLDLIGKLRLIDDDCFIDDLRIVRIAGDAKDMTISIWPIA